MSAECAPGRVLMTTDAVGGVWTFSMELARALSDAGVRVFLVVMGPPASRQRASEARAVAGLELFECGLKLEWMEEPWLDVELAGRWLLRLCEYARPDIVHLNGYCHGALPWGAPCLVTAHSCALSWHEAVRRRPDPARWGRYALEVEKGLSAAGAVAAPSRAMLSTLERIYRFDSRSTVIRNSRDPALFTPGKKEGFILTAGRLWDEAKNIGALQAAARSAAWPVCAAGPRERPSAGACADGPVRMLGELPSCELARWMSRAAVFALPARYEPFGLAALEAGLSGCALVLGDIPSLREVWADAAVFIDPDDAQGLARALNRLAADRELTRSLGAQARQRALEYGPEKMAGGYLGLYRSLIGKKALRKEGCECAL